MSKSDRIRFTLRDRQRLSAAMHAVRDARHYRRLQAVWLVAQGHSPMETAGIMESSSRWVNKCLARYSVRRRPGDLAEGRRHGRPRVATELTTAMLLEVLKTYPLQWGYAAATWTVPLLAGHFKERFGCHVSGRTLRRRMKEAGLRWKRPRYVFSEKEPHRAQKKGLSSASSGRCRLALSF